MVDNNLVHKLIDNGIRLLKFSFIIEYTTIKVYKICPARQPTATSLGSIGNPPM
jgi:hypothetical protein